VELTVRASPAHERYASLSWLIVTMTVVALIIGATALRSIENRLVAAKGESLALAAAEIAHKLDLLLAERYGEVLELSRAQVFREHDAAAKSAYLTILQRTHPIYLWAGMTDARGHITIATDPATVGTDRSRSLWFQAARNTGTVHVGDVEPFEEAGGVAAISFTAPIEGAGGAFLGVVTTRVGLPLLEDVVARTIRTVQAGEKSGEHLEYKFMTNTGEVFIDSDLLHKGNVNLKQMGLLSALLSESGRPGYFEEEHRQRHVHVVTGYARTQGAGEFPGLKWTVLLRSDKSNLVAPIRNMLWKLASAWVLVWLPLLGFSLWSARRLKKEWEHAQNEQTHAATAESKYRQLVEQARDIIYRTDVNGYFTYVNPTVTLVKGYIPDELIGRHFTEFIRLDAREAVKRHLMRQFLTKQPSTYQEFPSIKKDGSEIWIGQNVQTLIENDRIIGFHAVARDITKRKRAEEALVAGETQMRLFMEATADCIWNWDLAGNCVTRSVGFQRVFGYAAEEITPTIDWWAERLHPDDRERVWAIYGNAVASSHATCSYEYRFRCRDGSYVVVSDRAFIVRDDAGKVVRALGAMTDITERKRAEEARKKLIAELAESRNRFEMFFRETPSAISITTVGEGRFLDVNKQAELLTGYSREELLGQTTLEMNLYVDPTDRDKIVRELKKMGTLTNLERRIRTKSGEIRTAIFSLVPIQMGLEPCLLSIAHDVT
jgi:PAS domain S-box-containing protein